jgi:hypothetical protein
MILWNALKDTSAGSSLLLSVDVARCKKLCDTQEENSLSTLLPGSLGTPSSEQNGVVTKSEGGWETLALALPQYAAVRPMYDNEL